MNLNNPESNVGVEKVHLFNGYVQYIRDISSHRQAQFSHFMQIHLILLPAHAALITREEMSFSVIYSVLVAFLGMTFCFISYRRISSNFNHMEICYGRLHEVEKDFPYHFYTCVGEGINAEDRREGGRWFKIRTRRAELVFHWIIAGMYFALPFIHYNIAHISRVLK